jgi:4-hydroxybutyrate CoA-transferase
MTKKRATATENLCSRAKVCSPGEAAALVKSGDRVAISANASTPLAFLNALYERAGELKGVELIHMRLLGKSPDTRPEMARHIRLNTMLVPRAMRDAVAEGNADFTPAYFHEIGRLFFEEPRKLDVAVVSLAPPAPDGTCSYGAYIGFMESARRAARTVIAEVNRQAPETAGPVRFPLECADAVIEVDYPLAEQPRPLIGEVEEKIGAHVASLVRDGDCLQVGGGAVPAATAEFLDGRKDLGIHTELFTDWMIDLIEKGCITCSKKTIDRGKIVTSFCRGTRNLYGYIDRNPAIEFHPIEYTNDPYRIGQIENMVAINGAVQVDLTGQVNSESLGSRQISGTGGLSDFARGSSRSPGGRFVVTLPSTAKGDGVSRIVPYLDAGATVTVPRAETEWIVTEYGARNLRGRSLRERANTLIEIAHPDFREELSAAARKLNRME